VGRHWLQTLALALVAYLVVMGASFAQPIQLPAMQSLKDRETFQEARLSSAEMAQIFEQVEQTSFDYPDSWRSELRVRRLSLGDTDGLVIQGTKLLCGGTGNCQTWVFRRSHERWISMFQHQAPIISSFGFADKTTHGVRDLAMLAHASAETTACSVFAFDGNFYRETECYEISSFGDAKTKQRFLKRPCANAN
jgi:hypothetical protein